MFFDGSFFTTPTTWVPEPLLFGQSVGDEESMLVKELDKYESSVLMIQMKDCRPSTRPKLEKQTEPEDDDPC